MWFRFPQDEERGGRQRKGTSDQRWVVGNALVACRRNIIWPFILGQLTVTQLLCYTQVPEGAFPSKARLSTLRIVFRDWAA